MGRGAGSETTIAGSSARFQGASPESQLTPYQRDVLELSWPTDSQITFAFADSASDLGRADILAVADLPGATVSRITALGRVGRSNLPMPAESFVLDRQHLDQAGTAQPQKRAFHTPELSDGSR